MELFELRFCCQRTNVQLSQLPHIEVEHATTICNEIIRYALKDKSVHFNIVCWGGKVKLILDLSKNPLDLSEKQYIDDDNA